MIRKNHIDQKIDFAISFNIITWKILRIMNFLGKIRILLTMVFPFFSWLFQSGKQVKIIKIHLVCHNGIFSLLSGIFTKYICCIFALQSLHSISKFLMTKTMCTVIALRYGTRFGTRIFGITNNEIQTRKKRLIHNLPRIGWLFFITAQIYKINEFLWEGWKVHQQPLLNFQARKMK